ncbi:HdeD family acid-resistance protein [Weissella hellenica]|uniref:DUF308 domain-containing protein n=1 Tax=Weissella hellenica TaxID=46256 RepID=A0A4Y4G8N3_WEIHE|nr:DUF308 domain-containing protein [Weissella hellenica]NKY67537.1 DUF308 domain-containing protein [Weissella hellenica]GED36510.1 hypothetical protein WHE01_14140 [Weissella hellenica]SCC09163.1 Uncharacterized membrane protein HdeD, DUF308 family [Weissella hellenica]
MANLPEIKHETINDEDVVPSRLSKQPQQSQKPVISYFVRKLLAAAGVISIILGIFAFVFNTEWLLAVSIIFGLFSIFIAFIDLMLFSNSVYLRGAHLMSALLSAVMGLVLLFRQDFTQDFIGLVFGFWILFNATSNLAQTWVPELLIGWQRLVGLIIGVVGLALGLFLVLFTGYTPHNMQIILGVYTDLLGIFFLLVSFFSHKNNLNNDK